MIRNFITAAALGVALGAGAMACSDRNPSGPGSTPVTPLSAAPSGLLVSNAVANPSSATRLAYVAAVPGTFPGAVSAVVRSITRAGTPQTVPIIDGGFDPVGIEARAGDGVSVTVTADDGGVQPSIGITVPTRRSPAVIRTQPTAGQIDAPTGVEILVVFSEPVAVASITSSSVALLQGANAVAGTAQASANGLTAGFTPASPLLPTTTYSLAFSQGIRDRDGDVLNAASSSSFMTAPSIALHEIAFMLLADRQIYRTNREGGAPIRLTGTGENEYPAWSPDGQRIAFSRNLPDPLTGGRGRSDIYIMNADGSNLVRRTIGAHFRSAAWSPDGRTLAVSDEGHYYSEIHLLRVEDDGLPPRLFAVNARSPKWSPDGGRIAYVSTSGDDGYHQVYVSNVDGVTGPRALTEIDPGFIDGLAWSPSGDRIAYAKCLGSCGLYVMNPNGSGTRQVASVENTWGISWSPDGLWIAFTVSEYSSVAWEPSIAYVPAEGGTRRIVAPGGLYPSWRP